MATGWLAPLPASPPPGPPGHSGPVGFTARMSGNCEEFIGLPGGQGQLGKIPDSLGQAQEHGTR
jgi:hypothetical protein